MISRRGLLRGILAAGMAPAIVKAEILMPARPWILFVPSDPVLSIMLELQREYDAAICGRLLELEIGVIERFTFYTSEILPPPPAQPWRQRWPALNHLSRRYPA